MGKSAKNNFKNNVGHNNPFKNKFGNQKPNFKNKFSKKKQFNKPRQNLAEQWGKEKFVPKVPRGAVRNEPIGDVATPWGHFKTELLEKQKEEAHINAVNMDTAEAQEVLKQRDQNYRRNIITSQSKQPTKWEKFEDDSEGNKITDKAEEEKKAPQSKFKKHSQKKLKSNVKGETFANIDLNNFDAKKLSFYQSNKMRKAITKGFMNVTEKSLASTVRDMKRKEEKNKETLTNEKDVKKEKYRKKHQKK